MSVGLTHTGRALIFVHKFQQDRRKSQSFALIARSFAKENSMAMNKKQNIKSYRNKLLYYIQGLNTYAHPSYPTYS